MVAADQLSVEDLVAARAEVAAGRAFTVWFTPAAVGVPAGGSARVVSVEEPAEGDFIQVKPAGSRDTVFCSPGELTRTRPARKRVPRKTTGPAKEPAKEPATGPATGPVAGPVAGPPDARSPGVGSAAAVPQATGSPVAERLAEEPAGAAAKRSSAPPAGPPAEPPARAGLPEPRSSAERPAAGQRRRREAAERDGAHSAPTPDREPARPGPAGRRPPGRPVDVTVTLNASVEGDWTVEVVVGKKRTVRGTPVSPADVAKAARALPAEVAEAIDSALEAARKRQQDRVEQLRAELEAAQRALQDLTG
jgi:hypothetical protein